MAGGSTQGMSGLGRLDSLGQQHYQFPNVVRSAPQHVGAYGESMDRPEEASGARQHMVPPSFVESLKEFSPALPGIGAGILSPQPGGGGLFGDPPKDRDINPPVPTDPRITRDMYTEDYNLPIQKFPGAADELGVPQPIFEYNFPTQRLPNLLEEWKANNPRPEGGHWNVVFGLPGSGNPQFSWAQTGGPPAPLSLLEDISPRIRRYKNPGTPGHEQYMDLHPALRAGIHRGFYDWSPETGKWESTGKGRGPDWELGDQFHNPNKPYNPNIIFNRGGQQYDPQMTDVRPVIPGLLGQQQGGGGILGGEPPELYWAHTDPIGSV